MTGSEGVVLRVLSTGVGWRVGSNRFVVFISVCGVLGEGVATPSIMFRADIMFAFGFSERILFSEFLDASPMKVSRLAPAKLGGFPMLTDEL